MNINIDDMSEFEKEELLQAAKEIIENDIPQEPLLLSRTEKISMVNQALHMNHRTAPYILNDPQDFKAMLILLVGAYMDYFQYRAEVETVNEMYLRTIFAYDPSLEEVHYEGLAEGDDCPMVETSYALFIALGEMNTAVEQSRRNLKSALELLFVQGSEFQQIVLGKAYEIPADHIETFIYIIFESSELTYHYSLESNYDAFVKHIGKMVDALPEAIETDILLANRAIGEMSPQEFMEVLDADLESLPAPEPKLSFVPKPIHDMANAADLEELFLIQVGAYLDHVHYWLQINDVMEHLDETLEYTDIGAYADYLIRSSDNDSSDPVVVTALDEIYMAEKHLADGMGELQKELIQLLTNLFHAEASLQKRILGAAYSIGDDQMGSVFDTIFSNIVDIEQDYFFEKSRDNFLAFMRENFKQYIQ